MDANTSKLSIFALQRKFERTLWVRAIARKILKRQCYLEYESLLQVWET